jgi:hypothetical protein
MHEVSMHEMRIRNVGMPGMEVHETLLFFNGKSLLGKVYGDLKDMVESFYANLEMVPNQKL